MAIHANQHGPTSGKLKSIDLNGWNSYKGSEKVQTQVEPFK